jgi:ferredoxin
VNPTSPHTSPPARAPVHTVTVIDDGPPFRCPDGRDVLGGMEITAGQGIQVGCRSGGCGVCRIEVLDGTFTARRMSKAHVTDDDVAHGIVLACRTYPTSDLTVRRCPKPPAVRALTPQTTSTSDAGDAGSVP